MNDDWPLWKRLAYTIFGSIAFVLALVGLIWAFWALDRIIYVYRGG